MFKMSMSGYNSCPQSKSPLINRLINDRLSVNQTFLSLSTCRTECRQTHSHSIAKIL